MRAVKVLQDLLTQRDRYKWPLTIEDYLVHEEEVLPVWVVGVEVSGPGADVVLRACA